MTDFETAPLPAENTRPAVDGYLALGAAGVAWITSAYRLSPSTLWDSDYRVAQCLSGQAIGWDGILTAIVSRAVRLLPLGTEVTRLALISAFATSLCSFLCYRTCLSVLSRSSSPTAVNCWLSFGTATLFSVSGTTQLAASLPPGPLVAFAGLLSIVYIAQGGNSTSVRHKDSWNRAFLLGLLVAVTLLEQLSIGVFALAVFATITIARRSINDPLALRNGTVGLLSGLFAFGLPWFLTRRTVLSQALNSGNLHARTASAWFSLTPRFPENLLSDLGLVLLLLSFLGFGILLVDRKRKTLFWILVLTLPQFFSAPGPSHTSFTDSLRLAGIVGLLLLSSLGLSQAIEWSGRGRKSPQLLAQCLAVVIQMTLALSHTDETAYRVDRYRSLGLEVFTDEAITGLPVRSVILLRDGRLYRRFIAARLADGLRPDLLLVPLDAATHQAVVSDLLPREPALAPVLRELAINGRPSEFSLSTLADERPVFLEIDVEWDRRLREHLLPLPFFSRLYSQSLGRSDRSAIVEQSRQQLSRVFAATTLVGSNGADPPVVAPMEQVTRDVLLARFQEQLTLLLSMGDRTVFDTLFADYEKFEPTSAWSKQLRTRLARSEKSIDAFDLLNPTAQQDPSPPNATNH